MEAPETISIEEYNKEIEDSEAEIDRGEFYTHDEVAEMSKDWTLADNYITSHPHP